MGVKAIDVSYCQVGVDYNKVKADGIEAVIIRAGFGRETSQKDSQFETHYKNAKAAGLKIGAYWYSYADSIDDAKREASACLACIKGKNFDLPIYFDMEESRQTSYGRTVLTAMAVAFCETIKAGGYRAGVYSNANWLSNYLDYNLLRSKYSIWLAQWSSSRSYDCDVWQYAEDGRVDGIAGNVDVDVILNTAIINGESEDIEMRQGKTNDAVLTLKQHLKLLYILGVIKTKVDDTAGYGGGTDKAVREVQRVAKITEDGIVGPQTIKAIYNLESNAIKYNNEAIKKIKDILK